MLKSANVPHPDLPNEHPKHCEGQANRFGSPTNQANDWSPKLMILNLPGHEFQTQRVM
jgi:hypothetical protein